MRVVRWGIRLVSVVLSVVVSLFAMRLVEVEQSRTPFGTGQTFDISVSTATLSKAELIEGLESLADQYDVTLIKVVADSDDFESKKDIFWFGTDLPHSQNIVVNGQRIEWFDSTLTGRLLPATALGDRPLSGLYYASQSNSFTEALTEWARANNVAVYPQEVPSTGGLTFSTALSTGIGNATVAIAMLLISSLMAWFVGQARSRSLRLLAGFSTARIHRQDISEALGNVAIPSLIGFAGMTAYIGASRGFQQVPEFLQTLWAPLLATLSCLAAIIFILSLATRPTINSIATRQIPFHRYRTVGSFIRFIAVVLSILVLPAALVHAQNSSTASQEQSTWQVFRGSVRLSFSDLGVFDAPTGRSNLNDFLVDASNQHVLALSYAVDEGLGMDKDRLGEYDHLIITDAAFLGQIGLDINGSTSPGSFTPTDLATLSAQMQEFINGQFSLWTASGEPLPAGITLYTYDGPGLMAAGPNVGLGGETVFAKHALVAVVNNPAAALSLDGFLVSALSTGNLFFTDDQILRPLLAQYGLSPYVSSIDRVSDLALDSAQSFAQEARLYFLAAGLILVALLVASVQGAQLWAGTNERRIFTLHSSGERYRSIFQRQLGTELILLAVASIIGAAVGFFIRHTDPQTTSISIVIVAGVYSIATVISHRVAAQRAFQHAVHRQH